MKIKHFAICAVTSCTLLSAAHAADVSYNIGVVSLYKSNGVDQDTDKTGTNYNKNSRSAIQGGFDIDMGNGWYVGNWNSTGRFVDSSLEVDLYGGYAGDLGGGVGYDIGYAYYAYPSQSSWNGGEAVMSLSYSGFKLKLANGLSGSLQDASNKSSRSLSLSYTTSLTDTVSATATYGKRNKVAGDFNDYALAVSYDLGAGMSTTATYSGAKDKAAANGARDNRLVFGVNKSF